jgi:hypothetical protein
MKGNAAGSSGITPLHGVLWYFPSRYSHKSPLRIALLIPTFRVRSIIPGLVQRRRLSLAWS